MTNINHFLRSLPGSESPVVWCLGRGCRGKEELGGDRPSFQQCKHMAILRGESVTWRNGSISQNDTRNPQDLRHLRKLETISCWLVHA